jgi:osmotically-inducible protein OsmY
MRTDNRSAADKAVKDAVVDELVWLPEIDPANVGVSVNDGVVTLSGEVRNYSERVAANDAASRVAGVSVVVDDLETRSTDAFSHGDIDIAKQAHRHLSHLTVVPADCVHIAVRHGVVTLTGEVEWNYQRAAAARAIGTIIGIRAVHNELRLTHRASAADAKERIQNALLRDAIVDAGAVTVTVEDNDVTLTGTVRSAHEKDRAAEAAWASPNVTHVHNRLTVEPDTGAV